MIVELCKLSNTDYQAYLLRIWLESDSGPDPESHRWRFSLEDARSGARRGFADLETLTAFLSEQTAANPVPKKAVKPSATTENNKSTKEV